MKRSRKLLVSAVLALALAAFGRWAYREQRLRYMQSKYTHEFRPGMKRQVIEQRLLSEGIRFFHEAPDADFVSGGDEVSYSLACAPREVGLLLKFKVQDDTASGTDVLERVQPAREERGCM